MDQYYSNTEQIEVLIQRIRTLLASDKQVLVGLAGIPGVGKTTFCEKVIKQAFPFANILPMDGYHMYRKDLDDEGIRRRGAPFTFDVARFKKDMLNLKQTHAGSFPGFEHSVKDPIEDMIVVSNKDKLVVVEGLYVLLEYWEVYSLFDVKVFLRGSMDKITERLAQRHLNAGIVATFEQGVDRVKASDSLNAQELTVHSNYDGTYIVDV